MNDPPFSEVRSRELGPFPRRPFPWWLLPVTIAMLGALALLWRLTAPAPVPPAMAAPVVETVERVVTATATATPAWTQTPRIVTATATAMPTSYPFCDEGAHAGDVCVPVARRVSPTAVPTCSPPEGTTHQTLCRVPGDPDVTSANGETQ
jgi:hypothetical protein